MSPVRVQQRRGVKGWRKPPGARSVTRSTRFGNPYAIGPGMSRGEAVARFRAGLLAGTLPDWRGKPRALMADVVAELAGLDLMCTCSLDEACHADVLLEVANGRPSDNAETCVSGVPGQLALPFVVAS